METLQEERRVCHSAGTPPAPGWPRRTGRAQTPTPAAHTVSRSSRTEARAPELTLTPRGPPQPVGPGAVPPRRRPGLCDSDGRWDRWRGEPQTPPPV